MQALLITCVAEVVTDASHPLSRHASALAGVDGLVTTFWVRDASRFGAIHLFAREEQVEAFLSSPQVRELMLDPAFAAFQVEQFSVEDLSGNDRRFQSLAGA